MERGATVVRRGIVPDSAGYFCAPAVLTGAPADSAAARTEIVGPIAAIDTFTDDAEVIAAANATEWGLVG